MIKLFNRKIKNYNKYSKKKRSSTKMSVLNSHQIYLGLFRNILNIKMRAVIQMSTYHPFPSVCR